MNEHEQAITDGYAEGYSPTGEDLLNDEEFARAEQRAEIAEAKEIETFPFVVDRDFTPEELQERIKEWTTACNERDDLKAAKKEAQKAFKKADDHADELAHEIQKGRGSFEIQAFDRVLFELNTVETVSVDTGEVLEKRALQSDERQAELFADNGSGERFSTETGEYVDGDAGLEADPDEVTDPEAILSGEAPKKKAKRSKKASS